MTAREYVRADRLDNVVTVTKQLREGDALRVGEQLVAVREMIPPWHKMAVRDIAVGEAVVKFGRSIGRCVKPIRAGEHVHLHNLATVQEDGRG